jgi:hypothetical protein
MPPQRAHHQLTSTLPMHAMFSVMERHIVKWITAIHTPYSFFLHLLLYCSSYSCPPLTQEIRRHWWISLCIKGRVKVTINWFIFLVPPFIFSINQKKVVTDGSILPFKHWSWSIHIACTHHNRYPCLCPICTSTVLYSLVFPYWKGWMLHPRCPSCLQACNIRSVQWSHLMPPSTGKALGWVLPQLKHPLLLRSLNIRPSPISDMGMWYVSNVSIIFDVPCLFIHHSLCVLLHFVAFLCIFLN